MMAVDKGDSGKRVVINRLFDDPCQANTEIIVGSVFEMSY